MSAAAEEAKRRLEELISFFGVNADASVAESDGRVELSVLSDTTGRLIGHRGETLRAIEYLVNMIMKEAAPGVRVGVDIGGYRQAQAHQLQTYAVGVAEKVIETGEEAVLRPMTAAERRLVHMALAELSGVETESRGEDPQRQVVIKKREA